MCDCDCDMSNILYITRKVIEQSDKISSLMAEVNRLKPFEQKCALLESHHYAQEKEVKNAT